MKFLVPCVWLDGSPVKLPLCLDSDPGSMDLVSWLPGEGSVA